MECATGERLLGFDIRKLDHPAPLLGFVKDELTEFSRRTWKSRAAEFIKSPFQCRIGKARIDHGVELIDDLGRSALRSPYAIPTASLVTRHKIR